jgi:hypothetical protein
MLDCGVKLKHDVVKMWSTARINDRIADKCTQFVNTGSLSGSGIKNDINLGY